MAKVRRPSVQVNVATNGKADVNVTVNVRKPERRPLRFGSGNAKLNPAILTFSLPAGHACPHAKDCKSKADRNFGTIQRRPTDHLQVLRSFDGGQTRQRPSVPLAQLRPASRLRLEARDDTSHPGFADAIRWVRSPA